MIERKTGNIFETKARFIVNPMDEAGQYLLKFNDTVADEYPHVMKEAMKFVGLMRKCGCFREESVMQYVPADVWAMPLGSVCTDSPRAETHPQPLDYDKDYRYIINWFILTGNNKSIAILERNEFIICLQRMAFAVNNAGASIAIPAEFLELDKEHIIETLFNEKNPIVVEIWSE
mgnify:CR=1 FL=1